MHANLVLQENSRARLGQVHAILVRLVGTSRMQSKWRAKAVHAGIISLQRWGDCRAQNVRVADTLRHR